MPSAVRAVARHPKTALVSAAFAGLVAFYIRWLQRRPRGGSYIRGDWRFRLLASFLQAAAKGNHLHFVTALNRELGTFVTSISPFRRWCAITSCPKDVEHILKTNFENYPKGSLLTDALTELLGQGIFNADGKIWHQQRKTASKMFTASIFKEHIWVVVRRNARKLREHLEAAGTEPVDVFNLMNRFTLDTIGEIGFGKCIGSLEDPSSPFLRSFDRAQQISFMRFINPLWPIFRFLRLGSERDTREHFDCLDAYSRSVVRELLETSGPRRVAWSDLEARKSFVGLFIEDAQRRGESLSEDFLRDLVLNFLIAGRDTTAQALSWTFFLLSQHPECEAKAREEVQRVCGARGPMYEDMGSLSYLNAVLSEALRLYPSVPLEAKTVARDDTLPSGVRMPAGAAVYINMFGLCRDPQVWGADAEEFKPERWLERQCPPSNYVYPVFNGGPRECLGRRLAMVEMKACLATLLPEVSLKLAVPPEEVVYDAQLTIGMMRGMPCQVVRASKCPAESGSTTADAVSDCASSDFSREATSSELEDGDHRLLEPALRTAAV